MNGSSWSRFAQRSGYSGLLLVTFATSPAAFAEIKRIRLRARCKILREQAWQCDAGNAKWPDNF